MHQHDASKFVHDAPRLSILQEFHPHLLLEAVQGDAGCNIRQSEALPNQEDLNRCVGEQRKVPRIG